MSTSSHGIQGNGRAEKLRQWQERRARRDAAVAVAEGESPPVLLIEGPSLGDVIIDGNPVVLVPRHGETSLISPDAVDGDTGVSTWDGARMLAAHLADNRTLVEGRSVLELGAGTGVSGLAAALCGAREVLLTDLDYSLPQLRANAEATLYSSSSSNGGGSSNGIRGAVNVQLLDWSDKTTYPFDTWDVVLAADVAWLDHLVEPLVAAIRGTVRVGTTATTTTGTSTGTLFLLAHQTRSREVDDHLFRELGRFLDLQHVRKDGKIDIYHGRRREGTVLTGDRENEAEPLMSTS
jgi:hypothetical protein